MNQFKDVFTGQRKVDYRRAATCQKCIRAGGKHNDLDNVGFTARHHTFFEMLGNFSFGDYFKEEAILYAWEWVTKVLELPADRLYATVYETDDEAFTLWEKIAPELKNGRVMRFGKKDNYWSMGAVGPCGPCSEIHYDRGEDFGTGPEDVINGETERFMEIWNLVFMQFDQRPDGEIVPLPKPSVDTGAGLERITAIIQNVETNYGIDVFQGLIKAVSDTAKSTYSEHMVSHQVIADHLRALSFAIADGAGISNEGQGYVLRRILRRAARHGRLLGVHEPFVYKLVPTLVELMGDAYPELSEKQKHIENVLRAEEESFGRTLDTGLELFDTLANKATDAGRNVINGEDVFKLYDTYGFPYDLTEILACEKGLTLDNDGFDKAMDHQKEQSRSATGFTASQQVIVQQLVDKLTARGLDDIPATEFIRRSLSSKARLWACATGDGSEVAVILDKSPFYVEAGGQVGDVGTIEAEDLKIDVTTVYNHQNHYVHIGQMVRGDAGKLKYPVHVVAEVDIPRRLDIMRNHTATHLAHAALRTVLGEHIKQSGSYVGPDRLRFDFSHHQPMTPEEIEATEKIVNEEIIKAKVVNTEIMDVEAAKKTGAMALFGEKYETTVRVVSVKDFSRELCGGTHVDNISQIGPFFITLETGIASGVRRLEAITGREAIKYMLKAKTFRREVAEVVNRPGHDSLAAVQHLKEQANSLQKELKKVKAEMFAGNGRSVGTEKIKGNITVIWNDFGETDRDSMGGWIDSQKEIAKPVVAFAVGNINGKPTFMAAASGKAVKEHGINIGQLSRDLLSQFGGRGGGKPNFAQGTVGPDTEAEKLFDAAYRMIP